LPRRTVECVIQARVFGKPGFQFMHIHGDDVGSLELIRNMAFSKLERVAGSRKAVDFVKDDPRGDLANSKITKRNPLGGLWQASDR
jgi:hypothetical protein